MGQCGQEVKESKGKGVAKQPASCPPGLQPSLFKPHQLLELNSEAREAVLQEEVQASVQRGVDVFRAVMGIEAR